MNFKQEELAKRFQGVGASMMKVFEVSPLYFKNTIENLIDEPEMPWTDLGTKLHMYILQSKEFLKNYTYLEFTKPRGKNQEEFCNQLEKGNLDTETIIKAYKKAYVNKGKSDDKIQKEALILFENLEKYINYLRIRKEYKDILTWSDLSYVREAKQKATNHIAASKLLFDQEPNPLFDSKTFTANELTIYWEYEDILIDNLPLVIRSTPDRFIVDHNNKKIILIDIKTSSILHEFPDQFKNYKYYRQLALYWLALEYWFKNKFPNKNFNKYAKETYIAAVQTPNRYKDYPIQWKIFPVSDESLQNGFNSLKEVLQEIKWHINQDKWEHSKHYYENEGLEKSL